MSVSRSMEMSNRATPNVRAEGFTLIGVIVAAFIVSVTVVSVVQLMTRQEPLIELTRERLIGTNIAREGLELVRAVRDTNWFADPDRTRWLESGICDDGAVSYSDTDRRFTLDATMVQTGSGVGDVDQPRLYIQGNNLWTHDDADPSAQYSKFDRILSVDCSTKDSSPPFVTVSSFVSWVGRSGPETLVLKEKLYNWLP